MSTIGIVWDRINTLASTQGYTRSHDAFDFQSQPDTKLDRVYRLETSRVGTSGYRGGDQEEQHMVTLFFAQRARRDSYGAERQLKVDMDLVEQALLQDEADAGLGYFVDEDGVQSSCGLPPGADADFVIGRLEARLVFDRILP